VARDTVVAFLGVPFDGAATLGWPGARYAPDEVRRQLGWMAMRVQDDTLYWVDEDRLVPFTAAQLVDAGDALVVPCDLAATLEATRARVRQETAAGRIPAVVGGDDSILFPAVAGFHDAVAGSVAVVHFVPARAIARRGIAWTLERIRAVVAGADHVFLAVDIDVLDPAHAPGVGWHEPGGLTSRELLDLLVELAPLAGGFALNEVNPMTDHRAQTSILAANLVFQFAVAAARRPGP
jgi:formiminoglutamase/agmatinase